MLYFLNFFLEKDNTVETEIQLVYTIIVHGMSHIRYLKKSNEIFVHGILALYVGVFIISGFLDMKAFIYVYT